LSYLLCGRCGLQIKVQAPFVRVENCPRCLARSATVSPLVQSARWSRPPVGFGRMRDEKPEQSEGEATPA
jgi:hypothetical protein